jgi:hypothetical protein
MHGSKIAAMILALGSMLFSATYMDPPTLLIPYASLPPDPDPLYHGNFYFDASFSTIKKDANTTYFFISEYKQMRKYSGTAQNPLQTLEWIRTEAQLFPNDPSFHVGSFGKLAWIPNMYKLTNGDLLGFVHIEDYHTCKDFPCQGADPTDIPGNYIYHIGLAYSKDQGQTWKYCGNILEPHSNGGFGANPAGVPYIVKDGFFYVYFNERPGTGYNYVASVARAPVADVANAALTCSQSPYTNCPQIAWWKWDGNIAVNSGFNGPGLTGTGIEILPSLPLPGGAQSYGNFHSDAVYVASLKKYFISALMEQLQCAGGNCNNVPVGLYLFSSTDGVNWVEPTLVDNSPGFTFPYSTFVSQDGLSEDGSAVGNYVSLLYPRMDVNNYWIQDLYSRKVIFYVPFPAIFSALNN